MTDPMALDSDGDSPRIDPTLYRTSTELLVLNNLQMIRLALVYGSHPALSIAFVGSAVAMIVQGQLKQAVFFQRHRGCSVESLPNCF